MSQARIALAAPSLPKLDLGFRGLVQRLRDSRVHEMEQAQNGTKTRWAGRNLSTGAGNSR